MTIWENYLTQSIPVKYNTYYTDIVCGIFWGDISISLGSDTLLYHETSEEIPCIESNEMYYWYNNMHILINRYNAPLGWGKVYCDLEVQHEANTYNYLSYLVIYIGRQNTIQPPNN